MSISESVRQFAGRMVSLTGRHLAPDPARQEPEDEKEARLEKARAAARLAVRVKAAPGQGWFPGDGL